MLKICDSVFFFSVLFVVYHDFKLHKYKIIHDENEIISWLYVKQQENDDQMDHWTDGTFILVFGFLYFNIYFCSCIMQRKSEKFHFHFRSCFCCCIVAIMPNTLENILMMMMHSDSKRGESKFSIFAITRKSI